MPPTVWPPWAVMWAVMWALAVAVFTASKWLTWHRTPVATAPSRHAAYLLAWPGFDAAAFLDSRPLPPAAPPGRSPRVG